MTKVFSVLVVESEPDHGTIIDVALGLNTALSCQLAATGKEALDRLRRRDFDVILLDPALSDIPGPDLMNAIHERDPAPVVVLVTADTRPASADLYRALGACAVITKPFDPLTLARDLLRHASMARSPVPQP